MNLKGLIVVSRLIVTGKLTPREYSFYGRNPPHIQRIAEKCGKHMTVRDKKGFFVGILSKDSIVENPLSVLVYLKSIIEIDTSSIIDDSLKEDIKEALPKMLLYRDSKGSVKLDMKNIELQRLPSSEFRHCILRAEVEYRKTYV